jgi:NAD(P)H-dependent FMN reductase
MPSYTPEYNHGVPAMLKNAIDCDCNVGFRNPAALHGYSAGLGARVRAIEHLVQIAAYAAMVALSSERTC